MGKNLFRVVENPKILPNFLRCPDTFKKYVLQKKWVKTAIPALSSGQSNLHTPMWGPSRQLDDPYRNPNTNNRDHLVGQLTRVGGESGVYKHIPLQNLPSFDQKCAEVKMKYM